MENSLSDRRAYEKTHSSGIVSGIGAVGCRQSGGRKKIKVSVAVICLKISERGSRSIFFPKELLISDCAHSGMGLTSQNQYRSILRLNW